MVENVILVKNASNGQPSLDVSWDMPSSDRPILYYEVEYIEMGMDWPGQSLNSNATYTTLTGLMPATTYEVRVRAVSDVGNGNWSDTVNETTFDGRFNLNTCTTLWLYCYTILCIYCKICIVQLQYFVKLEIARF